MMKMKAITPMKLIRRMALMVMVTGSFHAAAQIGVNTLTPDSSAALDIQPSSTRPNSGLLIPRLNQAQRTGVPGPAKGLMVFDLNDNMFYVNMSAAVHNWFAINPWQTKASSATSGPANVMYTHSTVTNVGIGISTPSEKLEVAGKIKATAVKVDSVVVPGFANNALVPTGAIIMWSGTTAPAGWGLCNGATYTTPGGSITAPDLRGKFVVGYHSILPDYDQPGNLSTGGVTTGDTGGEEFHTLTKGELPKHQHVIGNGTDGASLSNPGDHTHGYTTRDGGGHETGNATDNLGYWNTQTDGAGNHTHTGISGDGTTDGLNGQPHENRPPYYVLAYIIKLP